MNITLNEESLRTLLEAAYRSGWGASGEGWNGEYPEDASQKEGWAIDMRDDVESLIRSAKVIGEMRNG